MPDVRSLLRALDPADVRDALALATAIVVVGASFGALAAAGGDAAAAVAAGLLLNLRHLPFGLAVGDTVGRGWAAKLVGAHLLVDETVAFSRARPAGPRARAAYWFCGLLLFTVWNIGAAAGMAAGSAVPDPDAFGVDAAFPAGLLALLMPALRRPDARRVGLAAAVLALLATPVLPPGLPVLVGLLGLLVAGRPSTEPAERSRCRGARSWRSAAAPTRCG